jgi:hypothetical protein
MTEATPSEDAIRFRRTLARVMTMQIAALVALWWLQVTFSS